MSVSDRWTEKEWSIWQRFKYRFFTQGSNHVQVAVANGATSVLVPFLRTEQDTSYGVTVCPTWLTTFRAALADRTTTSVTIRFGTAAPTANEKVDVIIFRSED